MTARRSHLPLVLVLAALSSCGDKKPTPKAPEAPRSPEISSIHFSRLAAFLPGELLEFRGAPVEAQTSRFGTAAVSEVERAYSAGTLKAKIKIVDTNLNKNAGHVPEEPFEDERHLGRRLIVNGAVGFVEFDKRSARAHANLLVGERVVVGVTCDNARGPEDVERLSAALDLKGLGALTRREAALAVAAP